MNFAECPEAVRPGTRACGSPVPAAEPGDRGSAPRAGAPGRPRARAPEAGGTGRGARALCAWALALAALWTGCGKAGPGPGETAPPAVTVSPPAERPVTDFLEMTGTVAPSRSVELVARVPGYLDSVNFDDGTFVEKDKLLFVIEPEPYQEQLRLAQAQLLRAQSEYDRQQELLRENATSAANVERWLSQRDQAVAQVALARINLGYTRVTAPFSGRIGRRLVDPGNMVGIGGDTQLARLDQLDPIYVYFNISEREALRIRDEMHRIGTKPGLPSPQVPVFAGLLNEPGAPHQGTLDFVDSTVSTSTGTIQMRGIFQNPEKILFPGAFARVRIPLGPPKPLPVVPCAAIGSDQEGDHVLVVGPEDVVSRRSVVKGPAAEDGCAIRQGLSPGDRVIVEGLMLARPGDKVAPAAPAAETPVPANPAR